MDPNWPRYDLIFYLDGTVDADDSEAVATLIARLRQEHSWTLGPPQMVDEVDDYCPYPEDKPIRTLGGALELYVTTFDGRYVDRDVDAAHLAEVSVLMDELSEFSKLSGHDIVLELGGKYVGEIESGVPNPNLRIGLIEEWQRALDARRE